MNQSTDLARLLLARLERISVDSRWAHQASGVRGALLRELDAQIGNSVNEPPALQKLLGLGFAILQRAAQERVR